MTVKEWIAQDVEVRKVRDFSDYADSNRLRMDLYTRPDTKLSKPLQDAIECGKINLRTIPE